MSLWKLLCKQLGNIHIRQLVFLRVDGAETVEETKSKQETNFPQRRLRPLISRSLFVL